MLAKLGKQCDVLLVTSLDDIAWVLNLRGSDISYNPVFFAYLLFMVPQEEGQKPSLKLFVSLDKLKDETVQAHLKENNIEAFDYSAVTEYLKQLVSEKKKIGFDDSVCN